jgi:hypothetical protein
MRHDHQLLEAELLLTTTVVALLPTDRSKVLLDRRRDASLESRASYRSPLEEDLPNHVLQLRGSTRPASRINEKKGLCRGLGWKDGTISYNRS